MKSNHVVFTPYQISSSSLAEGHSSEDGECCNHNYERPNSLDIKKATGKSQSPSHDPPWNPSSMSPVSNADQQKSLLNSTSEISSSPTLLLEQQMLQQQQQQQQQQQWPVFVDKSQQVAGHLQSISAKLYF